MPRTNRNLANRQTSIQLDETMRQKVYDLAIWWGLSPKRNITTVFRRLVDEAHARESARRELATFDQLQASEPDPLA